ncbi:40S ribosomal protein S6 [Orobanche minor]
MASSPYPSSSALMVSKPPRTRPHSPSLNFITPLSKCPIKIPQLERRVNFQRTTFDVKAEFDFSFFGRNFGRGGAPPEVPGMGFPEVEDEEEPPCPPGLRKYETMVVLRPDMSEDERLAFTQKYEELLVAGGGMYVEVFNRGVIPLSYNIRRKNRDGETNTYLDGIYILFTYFTKPDSMSILGETLQADDNVIRSSSFKIIKRKLFKKKKKNTQISSDEKWI